MKRIFNFIKPYLFATFCFIVSVILIKTIEAFAISNDITFEIYLRSIATNLTASGIICICLLPIYLAINLFSPKGALLTTSILLSIVILSEISLAVYTAHNGTLLGAELLVRPAEESLMAVKGAFGTFVPIISVIAIVAGFTTIVMLLSKLNIKVGIHISALAVILLSIPCIFLSKKYQGKEKVENNYITFKTYFLVSDCLSFMEYSTKDDSEYCAKIDYNKEYIDTYIKDNPDFIVPDPLYPIERIDNTPDVLSKYFNPSDKKPNIVLIIVESLGHEFMEPCFAPFIDSLAQTGLYWPNCLSTTTRSFGAVPAITGSVTGPKGFQFGTMPQHNSLISTLKDNDYQTNAFYAGYWEFDCIYEYLTEERIDYMSPFYKEYQEANDNSLGTWWGYHDEILFDRTFNIIKAQNKNPKFNLIITLSTHDGMDLASAEQEDVYLKKSSDVADKYGRKIKSLYNTSRFRYAGIMYADECIKDFFSQYKTLPDYNNTIFIITGDHSSGENCNDDLAFHRVPLIIWSPLQKGNDRFNSIVTHNDILPSLTKLLKNNFGLTIPQTTHAIGTGLDTSKDVSKTKKMLILGYDRNKDFVYNNHYFNRKTNKLYTINDDLSLSETNDDKTLEEISQKLDIYEYVYRYTYNNNALTKHPILKRESYDTIKQIYCDKDIVCVTPDRKPSEIGVNSYDLLPEIIIEKKLGYRKARISIDATIFINDSLDIKNYSDIVFVCYSNNNMIYSPDKIVRYIEDETIRQGQEYKLELKKTFNLDTENNNVISVSIKTPAQDIFWTPNSKITIKNAVITLECSK